MKIVLTPKEAETYFLNSLCNARGYMRGYGLEIDIDGTSKNYEKAKKSLKEKGEEVIGYESVWMEVLRLGGTITCKDFENDGEYTRTISIKDIHERVEKTPAEWLLQMHNEEDDATTADCILQTVFFEEIIFG
jgi:hypothetical protein